MEEWKEYKLEEVCTELSDGLHKAPKFVLGGDYIFVNAKNIVGGFIMDNDPTKKSTHEEYLKYMSPLNNTTILYSIDGTIGNIALYRGEKCILGKGACYINPDSNILDRMFLYYELQTPRFKSYIDIMSTGSTIKHISLKTMRGYVFTCPSLGTQRKISSILKSLDDKIECNRRINENLEQQAQALFKSWFVDFEPFKDQPFEESELGLIPNGWKVGKLGDICQFKRGKGLLSKDAIPGIVPVVAGGLEPSCYHYVSNTKAPVVTVSASGANAGFMRMYYQEVWASDCSFIDSSCEYLYFVYCFLAVNRRLLKHAQTGAVQPHVKPADIHNFNLVIPTKDIITKFQDVIAESFIMRGNNEKESRRLAELRDVLLPRLMTGELKLNDIAL